MLAGVDINESFNPYFYGTSTSTFFCWRAFARVTKFQSLFLWNIYFNTITDCQHFFKRFCFNPYFYGTSTSTDTAAVGFALFRRFQSLFLWNIYFNLTPLEVPSQCKSVSILIFMEHLLQPGHLSAEDREKIAFQSLFLWNIYFNSIRTPKDHMLVLEFQSLFLWNIYFNLL